MDCYFSSRYRHQMPLFNECNSCREAEEASLPEEIIDAVDKGSINVIKDYLENDGNVNSIHEGETLLYRACAQNQVEILKLLLKCPDIHLNMPTEEDTTPFDIAAQNENLECADLLLNSTVNCAIDIGKNWAITGKYLKTKPNLNARSASQILRQAIDHIVWDIIESLLETEHIFHQEDLERAVNAAMNYNQWNILLKVFRKNYYGKDNNIKEVFGLMVTMKDWDRAREILQLIDAQLKFDVNFVETALAGNVAEVQRLLTDGNYDSQTMNGNLIVSAALGVTDFVAETLLTVKNVYTKETYSNALFFAGFSFCMEMHNKLLYHPEACLSVNDISIAYDLMYRNRRHGIYYVVFEEHSRACSKKAKC